MSRMRVFGKARIRCLSGVWQFENEVLFGGKFKDVIQLVNLSNASEKKLDHFTESSHRYVVECDGVCSLSLT